MSSPPPILAEKESEDGSPPASLRCSWPTSKVPSTQLSTILIG